MTISINVNGLTLCHRGSGGISRNTLPDVCKTPSSGAPLPYSNTAYSKDLAKGSTSVFADGGHMIANNGSIFAKSIGDEGGSMGGIRSGTHLAEAEWITHSFDVFIERKAACRLTDKMFMNHRNTVNMAGLIQHELAALQKAIAQFVCECDEEIKPSATDNCMTLGNKKHECVDKKKEDDNKKRKADNKKPAHDSEKGYKVDENGRVIRENGKPKIDDIGERRVQKSATVDRLKGAYQKASGAVESASTRVARITAKLGSSKAAVGAGKALSVASKAFFVVGIMMEMVYTSPEDMAILEAAEAKRAAEAAATEASKAAAELAKAEAEAITRRAGYKYPDGAVVDGDGKIREVSEYKFPCPKGTPTGGKNKQGAPSVSRGKGTGNWTRGQERSYKDILDDLIAGGEATIDAELKKYTTTECPGRSDKTQARRSGSAKKLGKK